MKIKTLAIKLSGLLGSLPAGVVSVEINNNADQPVRIHVTEEEFMKTFKEYRVHNFSVYYDELYFEINGARIFATKEKV